MNGFATQASAPSSMPARWSSDSRDGRETRTTGTWNSVFSRWQTS